MTGIAPGQAGATAPFQASAITRVVKTLTAATQRETKARWLQAVARRVVTLRPDIAEGLLDLLGVQPLDADVLQGRTIGEISVCYEALLARLDAAGRRSAGQYFTPDDAARFMAEQSATFPDGIWMDPCCGVGNLAWHLASVQHDPTAFVREKLTLVDRDEDALRSAVALIAAEYLGDGDHSGLMNLRSRAVRRDFLARPTLPNHDFVIVNPPYARDRERSGFETASTRESFAYFIERVARESRGFISVTPASYISAPKFQCLRTLIDRNTTGGDVFIFDNVPDTLFRGFKFGSSNTSKTNFVRAAITVCSPTMNAWRTTPILRWKSVSRKRMFESAEGLLSPRRTGPSGEWTKMAPQIEPVWDILSQSPDTVGSLTVKRATQFKLTVALTPRYFISASFRDLDRGSKAVLYFATEQDRDRVAIVLNSSIPYLWWRVLDGGVTLPRRVLASTPVPLTASADSNLVNQLKESEEASVVTKLNAGSVNENVKRPKSLVRKLDDLLLPGVNRDFSLLYAEDMFPPHQSPILKRTAKVRKRDQGCQVAVPNSSTSSRPISTAT